MLAFTYLNADGCVFCTEEFIETQSAFTSEYFRICPTLRPQMKGHLLVIPKRHIVKAHELTQEEWAELSVIMPKIVEVFSTHLQTDQYIIFEKNGPKAFQHIPHVHFHLMPITSQTWDEIFNVLMKDLSPEDLKKDVDLFRSYFSSETCSKRSPG